MHIYEYIGMYILTYLHICMNVHVCIYKCFISKQVLMFNEEEFNLLSESQRKEICSSWKKATTHIVRSSNLRKNPAYVMVSGFISNPICLSVSGNAL